MAKDDQNNDKDEDDFFGDDEDFGLPELDYDALDDDSDDDASFDDFSDDDFSSDVAEDDLSGDDFGDMDDVFSDDESKEEETVEEEFTAMDNASEDSEEFFNEESFDDFESSADESDDMDVSDDDLGDLDMEGDDIDIDEDEFKDFESDLIEGEDDFSGLEMSDEFSSEEYADAPSEAGESASKGKFARIVIIGVIIFATLGGLFWWLAPKFTGGDEELADNSETEKQEKAEKIVEQPVVKRAEVPAEEKVEDDNAATPVAEKPASKPKPQPKPKTQSNTAVSTSPGQVNALTDRTNNYYIVIASFLDEDLAMDHSQKLASKGESPTIIPPFGKAITTRVAIKGYGSLGQAQNEIGNYKGEYGQDIWILKY